MKDLSKNWENNGFRMAPKPDWGQRDNAINHFQETLKKREKQSTLDRSFKGKETWLMKMLDCVYMCVRIIVVT